MPNYGRRKINNMELFEMGRPRKGKEKHREAALAVRIADNVKDAVVREAARLKESQGDIVTRALQAYLRRKIRKP